MNMKFGGREERRSEVKGNKNIEDNGWSYKQ